MAASAFAGASRAKGRNPKTGDKVDVPPKKVPYFKPGKELKELINQEPPQACMEWGLVSQSPNPNPRIMDRLWAPWRLSYVTAAPAPASECVFCDAYTGRRDDLLLFRGQHCFVILNLYPYNNGHLMVVPNRHLSALEALEARRADRDDDAGAAGRKWPSTRRTVPHGINVGINLGKAAGAGIENHLHMHFVPRWSGDTNFMTAVGETRVLPEDLAATALRLRPIFEKLARG